MKSGTSASAGVVVRGIVVAASVAAEIEGAAGNAVGLSVRGAWPCPSVGGGLSVGGVAVGCATATAFEFISGSAVVSCFPVMGATDEVTELEEEG